MATIHTSVARHSAFAAAVAQAASKTSNPSAVGRTSLIMCGIPLLGVFAASLLVFQGYADATGAPTQRHVTRTESRPR